jgi:hypothetical protein
MVAMLVTVLISALCFLLVIGVVPLRAVGKMHRQGGIHSSHYDKATGRWSSYDPSAGC